MHHLMDKVKAEPSRFQFLRDIGPPPKRHSVIAGLLAAGEIAALVGAPGSGKSAVAISMALAVAEGGEFLGVATSQGEVVYVAMEKITLTLQRLIAAGGGELPIIISERGLAIDQPDDVQEMINALAATSGMPRLIVIDTLSRTFGALDENSAKDMNAAFRQIDRISRAFPTAALLLVHHTVKDGRSARGSSAILACVHLEITVTTYKSGVRSLRVTKANAIQEGRSFDFRLQEVAIEDGFAAVIAAPLDGGNRSSPLSPAAGKLLAIISVGQSSRRTLLNEAKGQLLGPTPGNYGERFRQLLVELKAAGFISFNADIVERFDTPSTQRQPK